MSTLQQALTDSGWTKWAGLKEPKPRKRKPKEFKCRVCGSPMIIVEGTNIMTCSGTKSSKEKPCKNFYLFSKARV